MKTKAERLKDASVRGNQPQHTEETNSPIITKSTPFNSELLPKQVSPYVKDVVDRMNKAPVSFAGTSALIVLSSAIGRRVGVRPKLYDDWTVVANLWGMLVAPPSIKKSPVYTSLTKPLIKAEKDEVEAYQIELAEYNAKMITYDIELKEYKKNIKDGKPTTLMPDAPEKPSRTRYILNDATIEKVAELMTDNPLGLLLTLDELQGFFASLSKAGREGDMSFWLEAFNGNGSKNIDRIGRGSTYVPHVCASVFGTIQPDVISDLIFKTSGSSSGGNGLLQRFQLIAMELESNFEYVDRKPNYAAREEYTELIKKILIANPCDYGAEIDKYDENVFYYRFSEEANTVWKKWTTDLHKKIAKEAEHNQAFASHLGKFDGLFSSLALILFYADRVTGATIKNYIPEEYAIKAKELCEFYELQAKVLYDMERIKEEKKDALTEKIINKVQELKTKGALPVSYGELSQMVRGANADQCRSALKGIVVEQTGKVFGFK